MRSLDLRSLDDSRGLLVEADVEARDGVDLTLMRLSTRLLVTITFSLHVRDLIFEMFMLIVV